MLQIFLAEYRFLNRYSPINSKRFILDIDAVICLRVIELVALVLEDSCLGENGEAMSKATRDEELTMFVFREFHCHMLTECRGAFADVNGYVEHCAFDTAYEFALGIRHSLIVKTTHHTI